MKKVEVDFKYLNPETIKALAKACPHGFAESEVISFTEVDKDMGDRIKIILNDTLFLINKTNLEDAVLSTFDEDYFSSLPREDENCDAEFCE